MGACVLFLDLHVHVDGVAGTEGRDFLSRLHVLGVKSLNSVNHCFPSVLPHISHRSGAIHAIAHRARWPVLVIPRVCPWEACRSAESQALRPFGLDPWRRGLMRRPTSRHSNRLLYGFLRTVSACRRLSPLLTHQFGRGSTDGGFEYFPSLLLVAWIPTMVLIWRFSARLEEGESPMDGDYSSSFAAGNSHS